MELIFIIAVVILIIWLITSSRSNSNKAKPRVLDNPSSDIKGTYSTPASKPSISALSNDAISPIKSIKIDKASVSIE